MAILPIVLHPHDALRKKALPLKKIDAESVQLAKDMLETMYAAPGIGLAANQVGILKRILVIDLGRPDVKKQPTDWPEGHEFFLSNPLMMFNPEITWTSEEETSIEEGCLSIPHIYEPVNRPAQCRATYLDKNGDEQKIEADGLLAAALQHEIDHLDGVLFTDHLSRLKRDRATKKYDKLCRQSKVNVQYPTT